MSLLNFKRRAEGVKYDGEMFRLLDLRSMKAFGSTWNDCLFDKCQFDMTDFRTSKFTNCIFQSCRLRLVNFGASTFEGTNFLDCDLEQASFTGAYFNQCAFDECRLAYSDTLFLDATVKGKLAFGGCNFHGSDMTFREVVPGVMSFSDCNFWGAKISMGCAFWTANFDQRAVKQFVALIARACGDEKLKDYAGEQYGVVSRAMDGRKGQSIETEPVYVLKQMGG